MWWDSKPIKKPAQTAADMLKDAQLSNEDRQLLTTAILQRLGALPLRARITVDETGVMFLDGRKLNPERAQQLHESSKVMLGNVARRFVRESVNFLAVKQGVHEYTTPEQGLFAKAALWHAQEEDKLYAKMAGVEDGEDIQ